MFKYVLPWLRNHSDLTGEAMSTEHSKQNITLFFWKANMRTWRKCWISYQKKAKFSTISYLFPYSVKHNFPPNDKIISEWIFLILHFFQVWLICKKINITLILYCSPIWTNWNIFEQHLSEKKKKNSSSPKKNKNKNKKKKPWSRNTR